MSEIVNIDEFLDRDEKKDLLRLLTAGSVDDGKSTLIGRLLFDSKKLYEDQLDALNRDSKRVGNAGENNIDYALLLDGLIAEREQGITIDVAYRYFSTNSRKFIIADTPGHEQYTRNMVTGASTANLAIILVDASLGVIKQTRRHTYLASLLGIKHIVLAVNKMDLVGFDQSVFQKIVDNYNEFTVSLGFDDVTPIPLSALLGDNVVDLSVNTPWYKGKSLLDFLETIKIDSDLNYNDFRYPVQNVLRPNQNFRGFSAKIASGMVKKGDEVMALPSMKRSKVSGIHVWEGEKEEAFAPQSITITLEDEIDISRGEMIVHPDNLPIISRNVEAMVVWMDEEAMNSDKQFFIKHTTLLTRARIDRVKYRVDVNTMEHLPAELLKLNEIGRVQITTMKPMLFDPYKKNRATGAFIIIDPITNNTSGVGMIIGESDHSNFITPITAEMKEKMLNGISIVSDKERKSLSSVNKIILARDLFVAYMIERRLFDNSIMCVVINQYELNISSDEALRVAQSLSKQGICVVVVSDDSGATTISEVDDIIKNIF